MVNETETRGVSVESRTIRKLRTRIIPFIFVLYVIAFIDRINIAFAALTMNKELAITSQQFGLLSGISLSATSSSRFPAICCCTKSEHASGWPASWSPGVS